MNARAASHGDEGVHAPGGGLHAAGAASPSGAAGGTHAASAAGPSGAAGGTHAAAAAGPSGAAGRTHAGGAPHAAVAPRPVDRSAPPLLSVRGLQVRFQVRRGPFARARGTLRAVDGVDLDVWPGETLGLVGESGCGKSTTGRALLRLVEPTGGEIRFDGVDVRGLERSGLRALRRRMQIVFQDPFGSLNPRLSVGAMLVEVLRVHRLGRPDPLERAAELLERVGLDRSHLARYPHEFSGGQRQRLGIARALAVEPDLLVLDEPVSALDVSVRAQVVNLLEDLQRELGIAYLLIAHDLALVEHVSHRVAVMYLGRVVETADVDALYRDPRHPYTRALLSAVPRPDPAGRASRRRTALAGDVPDPADPPGGCPFHPRCPHPAKDASCRTRLPLPERDAKGRVVACHHAPKGPHAGG